MSYPTQSFISFALMIAFLDVQGSLPCASQHRLETQSYHCNILLCSRKAKVCCLQFYKWHLSLICSWDSQSACSIIHGSVPGYSGRDKLYFWANESGTNLPPRKWNLPWKCFAQSFGAVREIKKSGLIPLGFPSSTCHPDDLSNKKSNIIISSITGAYHSLE